MQYELLQLFLREMDRLQQLNFSKLFLPAAVFKAQSSVDKSFILGMLVLILILSLHTHLHGSPFMVRPRPFPRAHKREASGGRLGTKYSPQSKLERMRERARVNFCLLGKTEPCMRVFHM